MFQMMKKIRSPFRNKKALTPIHSGGWRRILESFTGAWQKNKEVSAEDMLTFHSVFACITLIASDISKLSLALFSQDKNGVWTGSKSDKLSKLIYKPNSYQTRSQFIESWILSKEARGNTYVLKERRGTEVIALHVLHPDSVTPLITENGEVYYRIYSSKLAGIVSEGLIFPAEDIIHDRFNCIYHPLVGISPLHAASLSVLNGQQIQENSAAFFGNNSTPGGILTAPGSVSDETVARLKKQWNENHGGLEKGGLAILSDGLSYQTIAMTAADSQLIEQLKWTAEVVCHVFHVPPYKIGVGAMPSYNNIQALNQEYYSQCLQRLITDIQRLLNDGLGVKEEQGFRFDLKSLLMMDTQTQITVLKDSIGSALMTPNEGRVELNLPPVVGGDSPYLQQQNFSLAALAKRDSKDDPFTNNKQPHAQNNNEKQLVDEFKKGLLDDD